MEQGIYDRIFTNIKIRIENFLKDFYYIDVSDVHLSVNIFVSRL